MVQSIVFEKVELSDFKKIIEEAIDKKMNELISPKEKGLTLLSRKETAKLLCISLPTLHDWTKSGIVKAHRIGNRVLYKLEEVTQALSQIQTSKLGRGLSC